VFYANNNKAGETVSFTVRVRGLGSSAAQTAAQGVGSAAQTAAQGVGSAAQTAAAGVSKGVRQGVYATRVWAAPRLESFADYTTTTVAPKVDSAIRSTAQQIRPDDVSQKRSRSILTWSLLAAAVAATAGGVGALVRYKYRNSTAVGTDEESSPVGPAGAQTGTAEAAAGTATGTATAEGSAAAGTGQADSGTTADAEVNGRVSSSGW
jgi:hypothetical protein